MTCQRLALNFLAALSSLVSAYVAAQSPAAPVDLNGVRVIIPSSGDKDRVNFVTAQPAPLPKNQHFSRETFRAEYIEALSKDGSVPNTIEYLPMNPGTGKPRGKTSTLGRPAAPKVEKGEFRLEDWGTTNLPFSTARADLNPEATNKQWPYRAAGKLFFKDGAKSFICSGAMIERGLVVTAAHCVSAYGKKRYYAAWEFVPGYRNGDAPFGTWKAAKVYVLATYPDGGAICDQNGVVCSDDVAILALLPQGPSTAPYFPGDATGWFGYAYGPAPYTSTGLTHITQLGYPGCLDNGGFMERNDAQGAISKSNRDNTVFGSLMCGGSSGGPWIANFGIAPDLTETTSGSYANANIVVGVTSWGFEDTKIKQQGASPFLSTNIDHLVKTACKEHPGACQK
jgi:V8-like Glu-specific endopeptidase